MDGDLKPLGSITVKGETYTLGPGFKWTGPSALIVDFLDKKFNPREVPSVSTAVLPLGYQIVRAAAHEYGDKSPTLPVFPPSDDDGIERIH